MFLSGVSAHRRQLVKVRVVCATLFAFALFGSHVSAEEVGLRLRFGLNDTVPEYHWWKPWADSKINKWDGTVSVTPGRVFLISGWRFRDGDQVNGTSGWSAVTWPFQQLGRSNNPRKAGKPQGDSKDAVAYSDNGVLISLADVTEDSRVQVRTVKGDFDFLLSEIPYGAVIEKLAGGVEIERTAASHPLTTDSTDDDYPAAAVAPDGTVYVAYVSYTPGLDRAERARRFQTEPKDFSSLAKVPGGDQLWLREQRAGKWSDPVAVTPGHGDIYKCALSVDGSGRLWIFWSENKNWPAQPEPNFEIYGRSFLAGKLSEPENFSKNPDSDINMSAATDSKGRVWLAWQAVRGNVFRIVERHQTENGWSEERGVSTQARDCWMPAVAASTGGRLAIAWDTYNKGDYDVWVREFSTEGTADNPRAVTNSPDYEARPAVAYDRSGALWISWEQSGPTWGKDYGGLVLNKGIPLYRDRQIGLIVLKDGLWMQPAQSFVEALPGATPRRHVFNQRVPALEPQSETDDAGAAAQAQRNNFFNNLARLAADKDGNIWLFTRTRQNDIQTPVGSLWLNWAACFNGKKWTGPILVPHTDDLLYNLPAVVALPQGGLLIAHSSDHRQERHFAGHVRTKNDSLGASNDPFDNDIYVSDLAAPAGPAAPFELVPASHPPIDHAEPSDATKKELADVARCRAYRITADGTELRIIRGEFHRHTEISGDGGNDGPLEDMWRYALDVAEMDWLGCGDHDNGAGREYPWWLTQKTTDAFRIRGKFEPPFSYERSVTYPEGHRNVIFAQRGVRTLPRLPKVPEVPVVHAPDTQMLYKYLHFFHGVTAPHTPATNMGTDWRDHDAEVEPMVEIYQGCRQNYERPGAPRAPTEEDAMGGWRPKGFVNVALAKGYRLAFESSSDHRSTHISYSMVYAPDNSREALLTALRQRHVYAATDNIVADFRCGQHLMGDEFTSAEPPRLTLRLEGGSPFAKVTLVKDDVEIPLGQPNQTQFETTWTDPNPVRGKTSYYYVRGEQADGELVWASPMWITYQPAE